MPQGTAEAYKSAYEWKIFSHIVEMDFSGGEEVEADAEAAVRVYASAGGLTIANADAGTPIAVYTAAGVLVYRGVASDTCEEIPVPGGQLYLVKCGSRTIKVLM